MNVNFRLGAVHDGSPPPSYLGGPGAEKCRWEDGFIMSDLRHTERGFRWSPCTIQSFHHFLKYQIIPFDFVDLFLHYSTIKYHKHKLSFFF